MGGSANVYLGAISLAIYDKICHGPWKDVREYLPKFRTKSVEYIKHSSHNGRLWKMYVVFKINNLVEIQKKNTEFNQDALMSEVEPVGFGENRHLY